MQFLGATCISSLTTAPLPAKVNVKKEKNLNHLAICLSYFNLPSERGSSQTHCRVTHLLNSFSSVRVYLFCFALPQAILSSLISENNSLIPLDQSRDSLWKSRCTGCLRDLSLRSGAGSICSDCTSSFQVQKTNEGPDVSCRRCEGSAPSTVLASPEQSLLAAADEPAVWVLAKSWSSLAAARWGGQPSTRLSFCSLSGTEQRDQNGSSVPLKAVCTSQT